MNHGEVEPLPCNSLPVFTLWTACCVTQEKSFRFSIASSPAKHRCRHPGPFSATCVWRCNQAIFVRILHFCVEHIIRRVSSILTRVTLLIRFALVCCAFAYKIANTPFSFWEVIYYNYSLATLDSKISRIKKRITEKVNITYTFNSHLVGCIQWRVEFKAEL